MKKKNYYFTTFELLLWGVSSVAIVVSFFLGSDGNVLALIASLIGTASLILAAKGNLVGPLLMVVFSVLYGIISYGYAYYGEMITYLGMSAPIALATVFVWLKNPSAKGKAEVKINSLSRREYIFMWLIAFAVTVGFYFILKALDTTNLLLSTLSVLTSFLAAWLSMRPRLCGKRRCANYIMDNGVLRFLGVFFGSSMFCRIPDKRPLRIF